jgi:hypothetical protein
MVFNATFNNISVISWQSVLLVEEIGIPCEKHRPSASHWKTLSHNVVWVHLTSSWTHNVSGDGHWLHNQPEPDNIGQKQINQTSVNCGSLNNTPVNHPTDNEGFDDQEPTNIEPIKQETDIQIWDGKVCIATIWYTYMMLVTKYQISAMNSYWEKCDEKYLGRTDRRTEVKQYTPLPLRGAGV